MTLDRLPIGPAAIVLIQALLPNLLLTLSIPALGLPFAAVLVALPGSLGLTILPLLLPLPFGLVSTYPPNAVPARAVLTVLSFTLTVALALTLLLLPVSLFSLTLPDLGLTLLLSLTLLLLPGLVSLLHLLATLSAPNASVLVLLLLGTGRDGRRRDASLFGLLGLTLLTALGPLFLSLFAVLSSLLLLLGSLLLLRFTTLIAPFLSIGVRA